MSTLELGTLQAELATLGGQAALGGFTAVTITGTYSLLGTPASGTLTFTLTESMANDGIIIPAFPFTVDLDSNGFFSAVLLANDDPDTIPLGTLYGVTEQVENTQPRDYYIAASQATTTVDISTLMPGSTGWL